jgi:signal peptidase I
MADEHITSAPSHSPLPPEGAAPEPIDGVQTPPASPSATATIPAPQTPTAPKPASPSEPKDVYREVAETVVFVVVLVLLLKTFIAEAFVIPTGSMATTLWGYQKYIECPNCGYSFPVNASNEAEAPPDRRQPIHSCECPNCRYQIKDLNPNLPYHSGDRVLVFKSLYDTGLRSPHRHDVVVFKFPAEPMDRQTWQQMNYIKRLIGLPEETIAIAQGQLYVWHKPRDIRPPVEHDEAGGTEEKRFYSEAKLRQYPWPQSDDEAERMFRKSLERGRLPAAQRKQYAGEEGGFEIIRKSPDVLLAMRRIVFDNDFAPGRREEAPPRWTAESGWDPAERTFVHAQPTPQLNWLRYRHLWRPDGKPELITDFLGYNSGDALRSNGDHWVGDLILDCQVQIDKAEPGAELRLELSRGVDRFQARFNLQTGECSLVRLNESWDGQPREKPLALNWPAGDDSEPAKRPTALKQSGTYRIRLANVDERLTLWVNDDLPFGDGVKYPPADSPGPTANDLAPANIGISGARATVAHLSLWRDTYYTLGDSGRGGSDPAVPRDSPSDPKTWDSLRKLDPWFLYIQPGHYLCLGDNSPQSSDGRNWGMVPERLMLGRALMVYFPFSCDYWPIYAPTNRVGPIR